ncbi:MAG: enoyl-CoA hydratase-related protein, partial [Cutibacterium avidum]|nr:enoyl-CoA hydratase-related protein [Cutibacterium avidum]
MTFHRLISRGEIDHAPAGEDLPVVRIAFDRPAIRNAFRPHTVDELYRCIDAARCTPDVAAIILTGNGPSPRDGGYSFCSGGDQRIRGAAGYQYESEETAGDENLATDTRRERIARGRLGRLHILEVQRLMRATPKPIIAAIPGWTTGGGHSLMVVADMAVASRENARFKQVDANVGSFDAGYGSALLA